MAILLNSVHENDERFEDILELSSLNGSLDSLYSEENLQYKRMGIMFDKDAPVVLRNAANQLRAILIIQRGNNGLRCISLYAKINMDNEQIEDSSK